MFSFSRTTNFALVREILTNEHVYRWIVDDFGPPPAQYQPPEHDAIWYVLGQDGDHLLGLWMFVPQNAVCWEFHIALLPHHGYQRAREATIALFEWIWEETMCVRIVGSVPKCNPFARKLAHDTGMRFVGVNKRSFQKYGTLHDQILFGISRPRQE